MYKLDYDKKYILLSDGASIGRRVMRQTGRQSMCGAFLYVERMHTGKPSKMLVASSDVNLAPDVTIELRRTKMQSENLERFSLSALARYAATYPNSVFVRATMWAIWSKLRNVDPFADLSIWNSGELARNIQKAVDGAKARELSRNGLFSRGFYCELEGIQRLLDSVLYDVQCAAQDVDYASELASERYMAVGY